MRRILVATVVALAACSPSQESFDAACVTLLDGSTADDTRQELLAKVETASEAYAAVAFFAEATTQLDFENLAITFEEYKAFLEHDASVGYTSLIGQVDVDTVERTGRAHSYLTNNCGQ